MWSIRNLGSFSNLQCKIVDILRHELKFDTIFDLKSIQSELCSQASLNKNKSISINYYIFR